ncbi:MAG: hypothetical protein JXA03_05780 [Bacteroidales bacterium]|nr:hypothetical protein [Bacteroidales bacterium]
MLRGGSWNNNAQNCRVSNRNNNTPGNRNNNNGFRLALSPQLKRYGRIATHEPAGFPCLQRPNISLNQKAGSFRAKAFCFYDCLKKLLTY